MEPYKQLESEFGKFTGRQYASAVNSGTAALHLALMALGIGKGDEVIVPDFTFIACGLSVMYTGARPVFVDCGDDLNINPDLIEEKITPKTKAIMAVHIYSKSCDMVKIMAIAKKYKLKVIEDCSEHHAVKLTADIGCYSFQSSKQIHCEEGGILVTNNKEIYNDVTSRKSFCNDGTYYHDKIGFNYRMPNSQAKLALQSLKKFKGKDWVKPIVYKTEELRDEAFKKGVGRTYFKPLSSLPMFKGQKVGKNALKYSKIGLVIKL